MIVEISLLTAVGAAAFWITYRDFYKYKKEFTEVVKRLPALANNLGETLELISYDAENDGYTIKFKLPIGITSKRLEEHELELKEALDLNTADYTAENRIITLHAKKNK